MTEREISRDVVEAAEGPEIPVGRAERADEPLPGAGADPFLEGDVLSPRAVEAAAAQFVRASGLVGRAVVSLDTGREVGRVHDVVYDAAAGALLGFRLNRVGLFGPTRTLEISSVHRIGVDAVTIPTESVVRLAGASDPLEQAAETGRAVLGKRLLTESGEYLGTILDLLLYRRDGRVFAYEVSGGPIREMLEGRCLLRASTVLRVGADFVVVPDSVREHLVANQHGLREAWEETRARASEAWEVARDRAAALQSQAARALARKEREFAAGKVAGRPVIAPDGEVVVPDGAVIDTPMLDRAEALGLLHQVAIAASVRRKEDEAVTGAATDASAPGTAAEHAAAEVEQEAAEAARAIRERGAEAAQTIRTESAGTPRPPSEVAAPMGEPPVGRVASAEVRDATGNLIAAPGDTITPAHVAMAWASGQLDALSRATEAGPVPTAPESSAVAGGMPGGGSVSSELHAADTLDDDMEPRAAAAHPAPPATRAPE